jgi:hypothetical protein
MGGVVVAKGTGGAVLAAGAEGAALGAGLIVSLREVATRAFFSD